MKSSPQVAAHPLDQLAGEPRPIPGCRPSRRRGCWTRGSRTDPAANDRRPRPPPPESRRPWPGRRPAHGPPRISLTSLTVIAVAAVAVVIGRPARGATSAAERQVGIAMRANVVDLLDRHRAGGLHLVGDGAEMRDDPVIECVGQVAARQTPVRCAGTGSQTTMAAPPRARSTEVFPLPRAGHSLGRTCCWYARQRRCGCAGSGRAVSAGQR
jgi:hypothetical protein